jgi:hypothetical protein
MKRSGSGKKRLFLFALLFSIPALLYVYLAKPALEEAERAERLLDQRRAEFSAGAEQAMRAGDGEPELIYRLSFMRTRVPEKPYPERILRDMELLETAAGVTVRWVQIGLEADGSAAGELEHLPGDTGVWFTPVRVTVSLAGRYGQVERLLDEIETMNRLYHVDQMTMTAAEPGPVVAVHDADRLLECQFSFLTYYAPSLLEHGGASPGMEHLQGGRRIHPFS